MAPAGKTSSIPNGQYKVVSIALDLTGKKLIDEICHIGAYYNPEKQFSQYVMPHRDVSREATRMHGIRIFTNFGRYRVLKEAGPMKTLRTKSEYSAMCEFIEWLKEMKGETDGLLLAFHDNNRQCVTPFLLQALERYKMTEDFFKNVQGFVNVCEFAADQTEAKELSVGLRALCRRLLDSEEFSVKKMSALYKANDRAKFIYHILQKLLKVETEVTSDVLREYGTIREEELENLVKQRELAVSIRSLRPIFIEKIRKGPKDRTRAVTLRRYLIDSGIDYEMLRKAFDMQQKDGIIEILSKTSASKKEKDMEDLIETVFMHFKEGGLKKDVNGNMKEIGQGEPTTNGVENGKSASSTEETDEDEFEEAHDEEIIEK